MFERYFENIPRGITGIYKITNKNTNCVYIGQALDIRRRWAAHLSVANRIKENRCLDREKKSPIDVSLSQHGYSAFSWEIIEQCPIEQLNDREIYWINFYNSYSKGYNATKGGQAFQRDVPEYVKYIKFLLKDTSLKMQEIADMTGVSYQIVSNINRGLSYKEKEWNTPIRNIKKGVIQYDLYGQELNHFDSVTDAANYVETSTTHISQSCNDKGTAKGYIWRYDTEPLKIEELFTIHNSKIVIQLDMNGNEIKRYACLQDAADAVGCKTKDNIGRVCRNERKSCKGFKWKYLD